MHRFLNKALSLIKEHSYDEAVDHELCAIIVRGGKILSIGFNHHETNGFVESYTSRIRGVRDYCLSTHAEMSSVALARKKIDLHGADIFIARRRRLTDSFGLARPCAICQYILYKYGIRRAFYSIDDENTYGVMKILNERETQDKLIISEIND